MNDDDCFRLSESMAKFHSDFERTLIAAEGICKKQCYDGTITCALWGSQGCLLPKIRELLKS